MSQIKVEAINDKTDARILRLDVKGKRARTPQRALNAKYGHLSELLILSEEVNISEIYKTVSIEKLDDIDGDKDKQDEFVRDYLRPLKNIKTNAEAVIVGIFEVDTSKQFPKEKHIDYISDLIAAPQIDVVATPLFSPKGNLQAWLDLTKHFVKNVRDKPTIASIPSLSHRHLAEIVDELYKLEIRMFALDFNGSNPASSSKYPQVRAIKRIIESKENDGDALLFYGLNVKYGRIVNLNSEVPAKDMTSPAFGVDIFGINHKRATFLKDPRYKPALRVFDSDSYYYLDLNNPKVQHLRDLPSSEFPLSKIFSLNGAQVNDYLKVVNAERQSKEMNEFRKTINQNITYEYLKSKPGIANDKSLKKLFQERDI